MKLAVHQVGKLYRGNVWALQDFSFELGPGVLGLLGPNGAGKSTLMRILATVTQPSRGQVTWEGADIAKAPDSLRAALGWLVGACFIPSLALACGAWSGSSKLFEILYTLL